MFLVPLSIFIQLKSMGFYERSYILIKVVMSMSCVSTLIANECRQEMKVCTWTGIHCLNMASCPDTRSPFISWGYVTFHRACWSYLNNISTSGIKADISGHPISTRSQSGSGFPWCFTHWIHDLKYKKPPNPLWLITCFPCEERDT